MAMVKTATEKEQSFPHKPSRTYRQYSYSIRDHFVVVSKNVRSDDFRISMVTLTNWWAVMKDLLQRYNQICFFLCGRLTLSAAAGVSREAVEDLSDGTPCLTLCFMGPW